MISTNSAFRKGFSVVLMVCLIKLTSCTSGSKDTIPPQNDNSMTVSSDTLPVVTPKTDSATTLKSDSANNTHSKESVHWVTIENMKFNPATVTVKKGDQITFINKDIVSHNVAEIHNAWTSPMLNTGQSWTLTAEKSSDYYCTVHVVMKGKIIVK